LSHRHFCWDVLSAWVDFCDDVPEGCFFCDHGCFGL
jgi:hypothetical protein